MVRQIRTHLALVVGHKKKKKKTWVYEEHSMIRKQYMPHWTFGYLGVSGLEE